MAQRIQEYRDNLERNLMDKSKPWTKYFDKFEAQTGLNRVYAFVGLVAFTGLYLVFGFGAELICNGIAFVYPAYMSMKALESPQKDDDTKWLTYWVVFACFSLVEYFSDFIVGWFPFYWLLKCIFVIWCYMPTEFNGSLIIYHRIIRPYYQKHHGRIDDVASSGFPKLLPKGPGQGPGPGPGPGPGKRPSQGRGRDPDNDKDLVDRANEKIDENLSKIGKRD